jgi:S-adenosylmethionine uptake transporter
MSDLPVNNMKGALTALLAMGIFATHDVVVKYLGAVYSPFQIVFFAALMGFPLVVVILLNDRSGGTLWPRQPWWIAARAGLTVVNGAAAFYCFATLPLAEAYAILFTTPLAITILAIPMLGETVRLRRWLAVIVGLTGVLIVLRPGGGDLALGHAAGLVAAVCGATSSIIVRKVGAEERPVVLLLYPMLANIVVMGALMPFFYKPMPVTHLGLMGVIACLGLTGSFLVIHAYRAGEAAIVAPMQYSQIIWATVYGYFLFYEFPDLPTFVGASIIIASGIYIVLRENSPGTSLNRPVLETKGRTETVTMPRASILGRVLHPRRGA